jgi:hypothetical protein
MPCREAPIYFQRKGHLCILFFSLHFNSDFVMAWTVQLCSEVYNMRMSRYEEIIPSELSLCPLVSLHVLFLQHMDALLNKLIQNQVPENSDIFEKDGKCTHSFFLLFQSIFLFVHVSQGMVTSMPASVSCFIVGILCSLKVFKDNKGKALGPVESFGDEDDNTSIR